MKKKLFDAKTTGDIKLVDNLDFIEWASTEPNPETANFFENDVTSLDLSEFSERYVANYFLEEKGADLMDTPDKLYYGIIAMFYWRADLGLEIAVMYRFLDAPESTFGDLSTCTKETREYGEMLQGFISDGCCNNFDEKEWFMNATHQWLLDNTK